MINTLILLPGNIDNVFVKNELPYMKEYFDKIYILAYYEKGKQSYVINDDKIESIFIKNFSFKSLVKSMYNIATISEISDEIKKHRFFSLPGLKKIMYAYLYENFYYNVKKAIGNKQIDGNLYLYSFWLSRGAYAIARYKRANGEKVKRAVSRAHGYDLYEERNGLNYLPFREFIKDNLNDIFFISENGEDYFLNKYGKGNCTYKISRLGTTNKKEIKKNISQKTTLIIATCSAIIRVKRLDLLIDILSKLTVPYKWIHIGDGELRKDIEEYAKLKLPESSYEFLGKVDNSQILGMYQKYDVDFFVNVSDSEGIPVSIMEAMSMGIPVICRNVGGNAEIVDNSSGLLLGANDIDISKIEAFLNQRLKNEDIYLQMSRNSIIKWNKYYSAEKNYKNFFINLRG